MVAVAAVTVGAVVGTTVSRAEQAHAAWGSTVPVVVATRSVRAGDRLAGAVTVTRWPRRLVPTGALQDPRDLPAGARAAGPVADGAPVVAAIVDRGPGADGRPRVAVPSGSVRLPLRPGDRVSVWATVDPSRSDGRGGTRSVTTGAVVVSSTAETTVLAVAPGDVPAVVEAAALATVTLVSERR